MPHILSLQIDPNRVVDAMTTMALAHSTQEKPDSLINALLGNGLLMNPFWISNYFEIPFNNTLSVIDDLIQKKELVPFIRKTTHAVDYFLRFDIWKLYDTFIRYVPEARSVRRQNPGCLVDKYDIMLYYGIDPEYVGQRLWNQFKEYRVPSIRSRQVFYKERLLRKIHEMPYFTNVVMESPCVTSCYAEYKYIDSKKAVNSSQTYSDEDSIFRDHLCPQYSMCMRFSMHSTEYMDCSVCLRYNRIKGKIIPIVADDLRFISPFRRKSHKKKIEGLETPPIT